MVAARGDAAAPYWVGGAALLVAVLVLVLGRRHLRVLGAATEPDGSLAEAAVLTAADA